MDPKQLRRQDVILTFNYILPRVLSEAAALSLRKPRWSWVPSSLDEEALASARVDGKLMEHHWESHNMMLWENHANFTRAILGGVYYEPEFDITAGKLTQRASEENGGRHKFEGAVRVRTHLPFDISHDADATSMDDLRWIAVSRMVDIGWLRLAYKGADAVVPEKPDPFDFLRLRIQNLSSHNYVTLAGTDDQNRYPHHARLTRLWLYPSYRWPEGREIHWASTNIRLYDDDWRHKYLVEGQTKQHPLIPDPYITVPGRFKPMGLVENLLEPQWEYNKTRSQFVRIKNKCAKPKWLAAVGHGMKDAPDDEPNELVQYEIDALAPSSRPEPITPEIPVGAFQEHWVRTIEDFQEIGFSHEVSRGLTPPGVTAGVAIDRLQAADSQAKGHPLSNHIGALTQVGYACVGLYREFGPNEIVLAILGANYEHEFALWKKADSRPDARVAIVHDSGLPLTRGDKLAVLQTLTAMNFWDLPPATQNKIMRYAEYGQLEEAFQELQLDAATARRENDVIRSSQTLPAPSMMDNHDVHIEVHSEAIKRYREMKPETLAAFMAHIKGHLYWKSVVQNQLANLAVDAGSSLDMAAERTGDETDREDPAQQNLAQRPRTATMQGGKSGGPAPRPGGGGPPQRGPSATTR